MLHSHIHTDSPFESTNNLLKIEHANTPQNCQGHQEQGKSEKPKETWQLRVMWRLRWDPGTKDFGEKLRKSEQSMDFI